MQRSDYVKTAKRDAINALVVILFCGVAYSGVLQIPVRGAAKTEADFFPKIIIGLLLFLALCLLINAIYTMVKHRADVREKTNWKALIKDNRKVMITFLIFGAYILLLQEVGYFISSFVFLLTLYLFLMPGKKRYITAVVGSVLITVVLFLIFQYGLSVYLPKGRLF